MKRLLIVLLLLCLAIPAHAESTKSVIDYVEALGYEITETWESPGWRTCYLLENPDSQTLAFSDLENVYAIVSGPLITIPFDESELRELFVDLIANFDWDVSFFGPDNDVNDKYVLSYGIKKNLDKTEQNYGDQTEYLDALNSWFAEDKDAALQALYEKIESWNVPEIESNSIIDCLQQLVGTPSSITQVMQSDVPACAQFILSPDVLFAGPGGINAELTAFFPPKDQQWTRSDLWGFYGEIIAYLDTHYSNVIADGYLLSEGASVDNDVCIIIYCDDSNYVSFYNQILGEITTYLPD